jgi:hypothetical protein
VTASRVYSDPVFTCLAAFSSACGSRAAAAKRLGIAKGTLTKWFAKRALSVKSLKRLARFSDEPPLAQAAQAALATVGVGVTSFDFAHVASRLMPCGPPSSTLFHKLEAGNASLDELEFAAIRDLTAAFADANYFDALCSSANEGFKVVPEHPLLRAGTSEYEWIVFPELDQEQQAEAKEINWTDIDWKKIDEPYTRRTDAAHRLLECALKEPRHRLFELIADLTFSYERARDPNSQPITDEERLEVLTFAALDAYKTESSAMEAADTIRRAADTDRALERKPLHAIATKIYEMCFLRRDSTIHRVVALRNVIGENKKLADQIDGICRYVQAALYSDKGVYYFQAGYASAQINAHGSVIDYEQGRVVRSVVGKKRKAPKRAIVRMKSSDSRKRPRTVRRKTSS